jgi:membrane-associated phospholipid phosphatase
MTPSDATGWPDDPLDGLSVACGVGFALLYGVASGRAATGLGLLLANLGVSLTALVVLPRLRAGRPPVRFLGVAVPLLVFYLYYLEARLALGGPSVAWRDAAVARAELPWWRAMSAAPQPALLGEVLAFGYVAYVPMLLGVLVALLSEPAAGGPAPAESLVRRICLAWALCFIVFILVPVRGPRFLFPWLQPARFGTGPFSHLAHLNQAYGMLYGGSFPSAHVAATTVAVWSTWRWRRALLWAVLPVSAALAISCVYLAYHYVVDVAVGVLFGAVAVTVDRCVVAGLQRRAGRAQGSRAAAAASEPR